MTKYLPPLSWTDFYIAANSSNSQAKATGWYTAKASLKSKRAANDFLNQLKAIHSQKYKNNNIIVLGPVTPRVSKVGGKYRERIIIKCKNSVEFRKMISELLKQFAKDKKYDNVSIYADINPESVL